MASLFMGHGQHYDRLQAANPSNPEKLLAGDLLGDAQGPAVGGPGRRDPGARPGRRAGGPAWTTRPGWRRSGPCSPSSRTGQGKYAAYHLRKGEALYSSVVMRYTDQVDPQGVNELAQEIAQRSGIADVRSIQPGQLVKIPVEALASPFQPEGTVALAEEREVRAEVRRIPRVAAGRPAQGRPHRAGRRPRRHRQGRHGQRRVGIGLRLRHHHAGAPAAGAGHRGRGLLHHPSTPAWASTPASGSAPPATTPRSSPPRPSPTTGRAPWR